MKRSPATLKPTATKAAKKPAAQLVGKKASAASKGRSAKSGTFTAMHGTARAESSAKAELSGLLERINRNLDETEALLASWAVAIWSDLKAVALAVHRLTEAEKKLAEIAADNKAAIKELRGVVQDLRDRQLKIETRMESLDEIISVKAQATAALAVAQTLGPIMERLARLETQNPGSVARLPPPAQ
jgi:chromosome segregation ATPase